MNDEPAEISCGLVGEMLREHWDFDATEVRYAPVGFGAYHWVAGDAAGPRWFVTANHLDRHGSWLGPTAEHTRAGIEAAAHVSRELADRGHEFVLAPLPDRAGRLVRQLLPQWVVQVLPYLRGWSTPDGAWEDPAERRQIAGILGRLHVAEPPEALQAWDFAVPGRAGLLTALSELDRPWSAGPYSESTRRLLAGALDAIHDLLARYDALVRDIAGSGDPWVVTHGEPHSANVVRTDDGRMHLVDWDTVKLAPRERDLAALGGDQTDVLPAYQAQAGPFSARPRAIELFDLWWALAEICGYVQGFRDPHTDSADSAESWRNLTTYVPS